MEVGDVFEVKGHSCFKDGKEFIVTGVYDYCVTAKSKATGCGDWTILYENIK